MARFALSAAVAGVLVLGSLGTAQARGFGGFRVEGFHYGGYSAGAFRVGGYHYAGYSGYHVATARVGGYSYAGVSRERIDAARPVRATAAVGWRGAFDRTRFPTDLGLARYSSFGVGGFHTAYWSRDYLATRARVVRTGFGYYRCFRPDWFALHPACWRPAGWAWAAYWRNTGWAGVAAWLALTDDPNYYNYGSNVVVSDNTVWNEGLSLGTPEEYTRKIVDLAAQGQAARPPADQEWKPLGVFALVQGDEKTSNNFFQLAVNKDGVVRGNYFDGLTDTTTEVYGQVDKRSQRTAWTIGKKKDRVFEAGLANLTQAETPILVHTAAGQTQQWMLIRVNPPKDEK